jgi:hypothetical protein
MQTVLSHTNQSFLGELTPDNQAGDWCSTYLFGFNGMEKDPEITGQEGSHYTAAFWEYDTRIARRWNLDPKPNPAISSYATFANNPIFYSDPLGDTIRVRGSDKFKKQFYEDLAAISATDKGKKLVDYLQSHEEDVIISEAKKIDNSIYDDKKNKVKYSQKNGENVDGVESVSFISLGHELKHAGDDLSGNLNKNFIGQTNVPKAERNAVGFANYLRSVYRYRKRRTHYTGKVFDLNGNCIGTHKEEMPFGDDKVNRSGEKMIYKRIYTPSQPSSRPLLSYPKTQRDATNLKTPDTSMPIDVITGKKYKNR